MLKTWTARPAAILTREWALAAGLCLAFTVSALFSVAAAREADGVAMVWPANGFLAAALLLLGRQAAATTAAACFVLNVACYRVMGDPWGPALVFAAVNQAEAAATAWLARRACGPSVRLTNLNRIVRLVLFAVAPATAGAAVIAADVSTLFGRSFNAVLGNWFYADALGMMIVLPAVLLIARPSHTSEFRRSAAETVGLYLLIAVISAGGVMPGGTLGVLMLFPAFALVAFRLGPQGVAIGAMIMMVLATLVTVSTTPIFLTWSMSQRIHVVQFIIAAAAATGLCMAQAVAHHDRLMRLWASRHRAVRKAQARAVAAGRAKAEFLATMSHEIRTPMSSIVGFTEMLQKRGDIPEAARRQLALVERAGASLLTLVDDVLNVSRMENAEIQITPRPRPVRHVAQDALAIIAEAARRKGLGVALTVAGDADREVMIDDLRVRQVLLNLLNNAVKFTEQGRIRLDVDVREAEGRAELHFSVHDTGVGIAPDKIERLFKHFSQVDGSASRAFSGAGLGLSICKSLVEAMGGRIGVESAPDVGSAFWFEIPAPYAKAAATGPAAEPPAEPAAGTRVLLVDDHPVNRELGQAMLGVLNCRVDLAASGAEAVEAARTCAYDVILMDVHMPGMDGVAAATAIRDLGGEAARTPILALTADVTPEVVQRCRRAGMVDALAKPIQLEALHEAVRRWSGRTPQGESRAA